MASIGDYLRDFSRDESLAHNASLNAFAFERFSEDDDHEDAAVPADTVETQALIDDAYRRGREAAIEESRAEHAASMEAQQERHTAELVALRADYEQAQAERIAVALGELRREVTHVVTNEVAGALAPFLDEELRTRAVDRLAVLVAEAVGEDGAGNVRVSGPRTLFEALEARSGADGPKWRFSESDEVDLTVEIDGTLFATRLGDWRNALKEFDA